jgi:hypothetical protein
LDEEVEVRRNCTAIMFEALAVTDHSEGYSRMLEGTLMETTLQYWRFFGFSYVCTDY